jgi:queuine tRNA-ribosyltransferase
VRAAMLLAGWAVGIGDAIGGKAQTTAAAVDVAQLRRPLEPSWLRRLQRADAPWPADAPADAVARVRSAPQFSGG